MQERIWKITHIHYLFPRAIIPFLVYTLIQGDGVSAPHTQTRGGESFLKPYGFDDTNFDRTTQVPSE